MRIIDLLTEETWTRNASARDQTGAAVGYKDPRACKWCLTGALDVCYGGRLERQEVCGLIQDWIDAQQPQDADHWATIIDWNDHHATWDDIRRMLEELQV